MAKMLESGGCLTYHFLNRNMFLEVTIPVTISSTVKWE